MAKRYTKHRIAASIVLAFSVAAGTHSSGSGSGTGSQLATGHYLSANMPMTMVHPRPDTDSPNSWAYHKNSYPGIQWRIPVSFQGGAFPFYNYTINSGPSGLYFDSSHTNTGCTDIYDLVWDNPVAGTYTISISVTDQDGTTKTSSWSHTCGTAGWVFVDEANGDDANPGTLASPFKTINGWYKSSATDTTYSGYRVMYKTGTYNVTKLDTGFTLAGLRMDATDYAKPYVHIIYPGESPIFNTSAAHFLFQSQAKDAYFNVRLDDNSGQVSDPNVTDVSHITFNTTTGRDRITLLSHVSNMNYKSGDTNHAAYWFSNPWPVVGQYLTIRGQCSGTNTGAIIDSFTFNHVVIEDFFVGGTNIQDESPFYIKSDVQNLSMRRIEVDSANPTDLHYGTILLAGQEQSQALDYNNIEIQYCLLWSDLAGSWRRGITTNWVTYANTPNRNIWIQRNTIIGELDSLQAAPWNVYVDGNFFVTNAATPWKTSAGNETDIIGSVVSNVVTTPADSALDASSNLQGTYKTNYYGTVGREIN